jgi:hypothetical protein
VDDQVHVVVHPQVHVYVYVYDYDHDHEWPDGLCWIPSFGAE